MEVSVSEESRLKRAWNDTDVSFYKEIVVGSSTASILYVILPMEDAYGQFIKILVSSASVMIVYPIFLFALNFIRAPLRIAKNKIEILQDKILEYEGERGGFGPVSSKKVVALGAVKGDIVLDMSEGEYFTATLVGNGVLRLPINPPERGLVGRFDLKLTLAGRYCLAFAAAFVLPNNFELSEEGSDIITGETVDGGRSWRVLITRGQFIKEFAVLSEQFKISTGSKCRVTDAGLVFSKSAVQFADWVQAFPVEAMAVRMKFMIRCELRSLPKIIGKHSVFFRIYGPRAKYGSSEKFVRIEIACEVVSESGAYRFTDWRWSELTEEIFIHPSDVFNFRIEREFNEDVESNIFDVIVSAVVVRLSGVGKFI